jgi:phage tail-like protein
VTVLGSATKLTMLGVNNPLLELFSNTDASFQEVRGIETTMGVEEVAEGGENRFVHQLPKATKYSDLVLKRGVVTGNSTLAEWVGQSVGSRLSLPVLTQDLMVTLLSSDGNPSIVWLFVNAYPLRWEVSTMDAMQSEILTETLTFSYNYFERINLGSGVSIAAKMSQLATRYI